MVIRTTSHPLASRHLVSASHSDSPRLWVLAVGIKALGSAQREALLRQAATKLPDARVYEGHTYTDAFSFGDRTVVVRKRRDGDVEVTLDCDDSELLYPV